MVYISAETVEFDEPALRELLAIARRNNHAVGVSGMLLYHKGSFIQVLEGEQATVEQLFEKIERDDRHNNTTVIFRGRADERTFDEWAMGYVSARSMGDIPEGFHSFLRSGFKANPDSDDAVRSALIAFREGRWRAAVG